MWNLSVFTATLALIATACGSGSQPPGQPAERPAVAIVSPADLATVQPGQITVRATTEAFLIVDELGSEPEPGQGHVHFYFDVEPPTAPGEPAVTEEGTYAAVAGTQHTWSDVEAGKYTLYVQLVDNDHTPLDPPVIARSRITVADTG